MGLYIYVVIAWAVALAVVDFREHRLPDRLTLPAYPVAFAFLAVAFPENIGVGATAAVALITAGYIAHRWFDLGFGDVKLLGVAALIVAATRNPADSLAEMLVVTALLGGIHAAIHLVITRDRRAHIPFGPAILVGVVVAAISG